MKRIHLICGVGCVVALFAVTAFSQSSKPDSPCCGSAQDAKVTPCCGKQATVADKPCCQTADCAVTVKAPVAPCSCKAATVKKDTSCCAGSATCCCSVTVKATTSKQQNVYDLLERLEALKAKQDALESEVRETRALLNEKFRTLQERVGKATMMPSPYAPAVTPVTSCEPVTGYRVILEKNPETGETKRVVTPVTNYIYRQSVPTATTYGVPLTPPTPHTCVPAQPAMTAVPAQDVGVPVTPPESRPGKATKADRPGPIKPISDSPK